MACEYCSFLFSQKHETANSKTMMEDMWDYQRRQYKKISPDEEIDVSERYVVNGDANMWIYALHAILGNFQVHDLHMNQTFLTIIILN